MLMYIRTLYWIFSRAFDRHPVLLMFAIGFAMAPVLDPGLGVSLRTILVFLISSGLALLAKKLYMLKYCSTCKRIECDRKSTVSCRKISMHSTVLAAVSFFYSMRLESAYAPLVSGLLLFILVPLLASSRVLLCRHTPGEVMNGIVLGLVTGICAASCF